MSFWFWVGLIAISVISVPVAALLEKMKNRQPAAAAGGDWDVAKGAEGSEDYAEENMAEPDADNIIDSGGEEFAPIKAADDADAFGDGGFGFDDGGEIADFGDDDFK